MKNVYSLILWMALFYSTATLGEDSNKSPVYIGLDAEFGYKDSTSAEAIKRGILIAIEEINQAGGVLGGRPMALLERANNSVPARSIANVKEFAANPDVAAIFCGRFSPTVLDSLAAIHEAKIPLLDPWAAADGITDNLYKPNYVFRLSLRDSWAMRTMLTFAETKKIYNVGLLLLNTSWGRSNLSAAEKFVKDHPEFHILNIHWFNWLDESLLAKYLEIVQSGAQGVVFVGNNVDAIKLIQAENALPPAQRLPIISHWGVTGGNFAVEAGRVLDNVDFSVVQTYSFLGHGQNAHAQKVLAIAKKLFNVNNARDLESPVGVAHAYDLTHILAKAMALAGVLDRSKIRDALEQVKDYKGLIKNFPQPFTADRHDALSAEDVFMARYGKDGVIEPISSENSRKR